MHLPGKARVYFEEGQEMEAVEEEQARIDAGQEQRTKLTAYFELNRSLSDEERNRYTFLTIGSDFYYNTTQKKWIRRQRQRRKQVLRLGSVSARNVEAQVDLHLQCGAFRCRLDACFF